MSNYNLQRVKHEGRFAAREGKSAGENPYKPKTNYHRQWAAGHASVPQSKTPTDYTFSVGETVRWRQGYDVEREIREGLPSEWVIEDTIAVPTDQIEFNPAIHPDHNETGVGHHQWLVLKDRDGPPVSGLGMEVVEADVPYQFSPESWYRSPAVSSRNKLLIIKDQKVVGKASSRGGFTTYTGLYLEVTIHLEDDDAKAFFSDDFTIPIFGEVYNLKYDGITGAPMRGFADEPDDRHKGTRVVDELDFNFGMAHPFFANAEGFGQKGKDPRRGAVCDGAGREVPSVNYY